MSRSTKTVFASLAILILAGLCLAAVEQQIPTLDKYLTVADVQKVSGIAGVKVSQSTPRTIHFANADGRAILVAKFLNVKIYNKADAAKMGLVKSDVSGIGEEAYCGPNAETPYVLTFKKGPLCVELSSLFNQNDFQAGKMMLYISLDKLEALGKLIASRIAS